MKWVTFGEHCYSLMIFGDLWRSLAIFGVLWRSFAIFGDLWQFSVICKFQKISGNLLKLFDLESNYRKQIEITGNRLN